MVAVRASPVLAARARRLAALGNMFGAVDFQLKAKKAGVKPIFGLEVKLSENHTQVRTEEAERVVLLAKSAL